MWKDSAREFQIDFEKYQLAQKNRQWGDVLKEVNELNAKIMTTTQSLVKVLVTKNEEKKVKPKRKGKKYKQQNLEEDEFDRKGKSQKYD